MLPASHNAADAALALESWGLSGSDDPAVFTFAKVCTVDTVWRTPWWALVGLRLPLFNPVPVWGVSAESRFPAELYRMNRQVQSFPVVRVLRQSVCIRAPE